MFLFAEASESSSIGWIIVLLILVLGIRQWFIWLRGNQVVRGAAKQGALSVLKRLFK
jgi:hypothetical protein